jgi:hypothetical protein
LEHVDFGAGFFLLPSATILDTGSEYPDQSSLRHESTSRNTRHSEVE